MSTIFTEPMVSIRDRDYRTITFNDGIRAYRFAVTNYGDHKSVSLEVSVTPGAVSRATVAAAIKHAGLTAHAGFSRGERTMLGSFSFMRYSFVSA